jgi:2'-deoxynucleoside 5'-phosphate N-hydrolase
MIIYCAGPISGDTTYQENYKEIITIVDQEGHSALAELNGKFKSSIPLSDKQIYTRDIKWIDSSQLMIAEISGPSLGVGFEISYALFQKKIPVLAFASIEVTKLSAMITGCNSNLLKLVRYGSTDEMKKIIRNYLKGFEPASDKKGIHFSVFKKAH